MGSYRMVSGRIESTVSNYMPEFASRATMSDSHARIWKVWGVKLRLRRQNMVSAGAELFRSVLHLWSVAAFWPHPEGCLITTLSRRVCAAVRLIDHGVYTFAHAMVSYTKDEMHPG
jgi:hypothetical protein